MQRNVEGENAGRRVGDRLLTSPPRTSRQTFLSGTDGARKGVGGKRATNEPLTRTNKTVRSVTRAQQQKGVHEHTRAHGEFTSKSYRERGEYRDKTAQKRLDRTGSGHWYKGAVVVVGGIEYDEA